uniref:Uncharacterized protein n=1 Tax=Anguilla anguilla TaxID=7936 RepID=A0A0E9P897_ANGAN
MLLFYVDVTFPRTVLCLSGIQKHFTVYASSTGKLAGTQSTSRGQRCVMRLTHPDQ